MICLNGEFLPLDQARLSVTDGGFLLGEGVFETIRVEQGQVLYAKEHFARLARGLRVLEIPHPVEPGQLLDLIHQVVDANGLEDARVRVTVTRGSLRGQPIAANEGEPTLAITATALDKRTDTERVGGWSIVLVPFPRNDRSPLARIKSTSYAESTLARRHARRLGFHEGLLLNTRGRVAETAMANLFVVNPEGMIETPPVEEGALPGTLRARIGPLAEDAGYACREAPLILEEVISAPEIFLTNAIMQIMPVVQVGERVIGGGVPGPVTRRLFDLLRREIDGIVEQRLG